MENFDIYEDLELLHKKQKEDTIDDLRWKEKYQVALSTIQKLQAEKKELNKKIKLLEINFASLLDTARAEIKRKDTQICELRKQKDDICFRRFKPKIAEQEFHENSSDTNRAASSASVKVNPFSGVRRQVTHRDDELPSKERLANGDKNCDKSKCRDQDSRSASDERDHNRKRNRDRSRDRNRYRDRSRDRKEYHSRHRSDDRKETSHRDRYESRKRERSKERSSKERTSRRNERSDDQYQKRNGRNNSESRNSDSSRGNGNKIRYDTQVTQKQNDNRDDAKNTEHASKQTNDHETENTATTSVPDSLANKKLEQKIEILQIEILKDVKELKKSKLEEEKLPKPPSIDPAQVEIEKSNKFLDALFDDSVMNQADESNNDLYDDILETNPNTDSIPDEGKKESVLKRDENCNLNYQTPSRQKLSMEDLFGPSPAGSVCSVVGKNQTAEKSGSGTSSDLDFVPIENAADVERSKENKNCDENDKLVGEAETSTTKNDSLTMKTDENFNCQVQTPQKQVMTNVFDDLFGPSPASSIREQKIPTDEPSGNSYFEPLIKPQENEQANESPPTKLPILIEDSSSDGDNNLKETTELNTADKNNDNNDVVKDVNNFKFVEFDSSFYSSEDELNEQLKSPPYENVTASPSKHVRQEESKGIAISNNVPKIQMENEKHVKSSLEDDQKQTVTSSLSSHRRKHSSKKSKHHKTAHNSSFTSESDENRSKEKHCHSRSSHKDSHSSKKYSKSNHRHSPKRNRNDSTSRKINSKKEKNSCSAMSEKREKEKLAEKDQVFFLHCEDLSDDEEIFSEANSIKEKENIAVDQIIVDEETNEATDTISNGFSQNAVPETSNDSKTAAHPTNLEPDSCKVTEIATECTVVPESPKKTSDAEKAVVENVVPHELEMKLDETQNDITTTNGNNVTVSEELCLNPPAEGCRQEIAEDNKLENEPKNEGLDTVETNENKLEDSKEHDKFHIKEPECKENELLESQTLPLNEHLENVDFVEGDLSASKDQNVELKSLASLPNQHNENNENAILHSSEEIHSEANDGQEDKGLQKVVENLTPILKEVKDTEIPSQCSSESHLIKSQTADSKSIECPVAVQQTKSPKSKPNDKNILLSPCNSNSTGKSIASPRKNQLVIDLDKIKSSPLKKSLNSGDEHVSSSHSTSDSISTGRRKKIKTPRKRTDEFLNMLNSPLTVELDSNVRPDELPDCMPSESTSKLDEQSSCKQSETILKLHDDQSKEITREEEVEDNRKSTEQVTLKESTLQNESETQEQNHIEKREYVTRTEENKDESQVPVRQENNISQQQNEEGELSTNEKQANNSTVEPSLSPAKAQLSKNEPNESSSVRQRDNSTSDKFDNVQSNQMEINIHQEKAPSLLSSEIIELKQNEIEKIVETFSINIKRHRSKKKHIGNSIEPDKSFTTDVVFDKNQIENPYVPLQDESKNPKGKNATIYDDKPCCSASLKLKLNGSTYSSKKTKRKNQQPKMMKHFMDSEHTLVEECHFQSVLCSDKIADTMSNEIKTNNRKRKNKADTSLNNSSADVSTDIDVPKPKRKYKRKSMQFLESSISSEDNGNKETENENFHSPELKGKTKEKRKYTKKNSKHNESLDSQPTTSLSEQEQHSMVDSQTPSETVQNSIAQQLESETLKNRNCDKSSSNDTSFQDSLSHKEREQSSPKITNHHSKKPRKRKLSKSPDRDSSVVTDSKKHKSKQKQVSPVPCDTQPLLPADAIADKTNHPHDSPKQLSHSSTSVQENTKSSVELTPTHHKIFLNDVFPNDPPPIYKANDDDLQYHEIDDRMRSIFQSPSYTQSSSNGEYNLDKTNDHHVEPPCESQNLTFNETISSQGDTTKCNDTLTSSSKKLSLGSNEYVIESVGSYTANVFITRRKSKKRTKAVAGAI